MPARIPIERESQFPYLATDGYFKTSDESLRFNCIAYAVGDQARKWDPTLPAPGYFWPNDVPKELTIDCLVKLFEKYDYRVCEEGELESGYEKVALYADEDGDWSHVALQLNDGWWTSKLGNWEDIKHRTPRGVTVYYGEVAYYMKRPFVGQRRENRQQQP